LQEEAAVSSRGQRSADNHLVRALRISTLSTIAGGLFRATEAPRGKSTAHPPAYGLRCLTLRSLRHRALFAHSRIILPGLDTLLRNRSCHQLLTIHDSRGQLSCSVCLPILIRIHHYRSIVLLSRSRSLFTRLAAVAARNRRAVINCHFDCSTRLHFDSDWATTYSGRSICFLLISFRAITITYTGCYG